MQQLQAGVHFSPRATQTQYSLEHLFRLQAQPVFLRRVRFTNRSTSLLQQPTHSHSSVHTLLFKKHTQYCFTQPLLEQWHPLLRLFFTGDSLKACPKSGAPPRVLTSSKNEVGYLGVSGFE